MAASAAIPVAVGTRGTVGSLVRKEIEYFRTFDQRNCNSNGDFNSDLPRDRTRLSSWFSKTKWRRKKRRSFGGGGGGVGVGGGGLGFLPSMCSSAEVSGENRIPGFSYRILKNDQKGYT